SCIALPVDRDDSCFNRAKGGSAKKEHGTERHPLWTRFGTSKSLQRDLKLPREIKRRHTAMRRSWRALLTTAFCIADCTVCLALPALAQTTVSVYHRNELREIE